MNNKNITPEYLELLDIDKILKRTKQLDDLKVTLKHDEKKGSGLFAVKHIKEGETIAYYKMTVFNINEYTSPTNLIYSFDIYSIKGKECKNSIGDLDTGSFPPPLNNIPYWGPFVNEPSPKQKLNAEIDIDSESNYKNRKRIKYGSHVTYKVIAKCDIKPGEEITIYYGKDYPRNYKINIK